MELFNELQAFYMRYLQDVNLVSTLVRLTLAVIFGGIIGLERGSSKHQAGFRTHILVCVGSALAMLTNQFVFQTMSQAADPTRLGAQVISGIGFLGVGCILVTGRQKIRGLTTAAGLWASACTGLALGIGFYTGAVITGILMFIVLALLPPVENYFYNRSRIVDLYVEMEDISKVAPFLKCLRSMEIHVFETHISRAVPVSSNGVGIHLSVKIPKRMGHMELVEKLEDEKGVYLIEEI